MNTVAFYDTKPYDKKWFDSLKDQYGIKIKYIEARLNPDTAKLSQNCSGVVAFVNDNLSKETMDVLYENGIKIIAMRCAGFNNVDLKAAAGRMTVIRVPAYSPSAVAEHAMALLLCLNRKIHRAFNRTRDYNFSLKGLAGFNLRGKTMGIVGTGKVGLAFIDICRGFGMKIIAYDPYPAKDKNIEYVDFKRLCQESDVISLHCPLTKESYHIFDHDAFSRMKKGVYIINTSRGALIDSEALLEAVKSEKVGGACLDVYEEESGFFYEDASDRIIRDDILKLILSTPHILVTSHQAFLTDEALNNIAETTLYGLDKFFNGEKCENEISYKETSNV